MRACGFAGLRVCGFAVLTLLASNCLVHAQTSLIKNEYPGTVLSRTDVRSPTSGDDLLGDGGCQTKIIGYEATDTQLIVKTTGRPRSCGFLDLKFVLSGKAYDLDGVDGNFIVNPRGAYSWKENPYPNTWMWFKLGARLPADALEKATGSWGVYEYACKPNQSCLTSPQIDVAATEPLVAAAKAKLVAAGGTTSATANASAGTSNDPAVWTDPQTGLMWARCPLSGTWNSGRCTFQGEKKFSFIDAVRSARSSNIAGFNDWRLPSTQELARPQHELLEVRYRSKPCVRLPDSNPANQRADHGETVWTSDVFADSTGILGAWEVSVCDVFNDTPYRGKLTRYSKFADVASSGLTTVPNTVTREMQACIDFSKRNSLWPTRQCQQVWPQGDLPTTPRYKKEKEMFGRDLPEWNTKNWVLLVRGGSAQGMQAAYAELDRQEQQTRAAQDLATRTAAEAKARADAQQREYEAKQAKDAAAFNSLLRSPQPRTMYLGAVSYEDSGDKGKAKTVYRELMKRYAASQEALLASQRLTRLSDVEAVEASNSNAAFRAESATQDLRKQNYDQCNNDRLACRDRCYSIRDSSAKSRCQDSCPLCSR